MRPVFFPQPFEVRVDPSSRPRGLELEVDIIVKGLILAQNERWRRGLGMQVEREFPARGRTAAKGRATRSYLPSGLG